MFSPVSAHSRCKSPCADASNYIRIRRIQRCFGTDQASFCSKDATAPNMSEPRQHHYIPRFYLGGFVDPGILARQSKEIIWVYERGKAVRRSSPQNEARQRDFYSFIQNGSANAAIEAWLGSLENRVAPIISSLTDHARDITKQEREMLALFIGTMQMRTPAGRYLSETRIEPVATRLMKEAAADPNQFRAFIEENYLLPDDNAGFDLDEIRRDILAGRGEELAARQDLKRSEIATVSTIRRCLMIGWCSDLKDSIHKAPLVQHYGSLSKSNDIFSGCLVLGSGVAHGSVPLRHTGRYSPHAGE